MEQTHDSSPRPSPRRARGVSLRWEMWKRLGTGAGGAGRQWGGPRTWRAGRSQTPAWGPEERTDLGKAQPTHFAHFRGAWEARPGGRATLGFGSGRDPRGHTDSAAPAWDSPSPALPLPHSRNTYIYLLKRTLYFSE